MTTLDRAVGEQAARQHGLISRAQAKALGASSSMVQTRLQRGTWHAVARGVYAISGAPPSWHARVLAACLATGGVASHRTAAALLGALPIEEAVAEISAPRHCGAAPPGVTVHRSRDLHLCTPIEVDGIPTTPPARLAVDLGAVLKPFWRYERVIESLIAAKALTWEDMLTARVDHGRKGRDGVGAARDLLLEQYGKVVPESVLERVFLRLIRQNQLPEPVAQLPIFDQLGFIARVDFAYPPARLVIELDGYRWHGDRQAFERDRAKRARLVAEGWTVLVFTWRMVIDDPDAVVRAVRRSLSGTTVME